MVFFGSSRPICVNMCAQWKITHKWHLHFDLAFMSALPFYDSLISCPKPHLIPEPLLSITRVQSCLWHFFLEFLWRQAGISGLRDRVPFRQGRGVNWLVPSSSSTPVPSSFSLHPRTPSAGRPPPGPPVQSRIRISSTRGSFSTASFPPWMPVNASIFESRMNSHFV